MTAEMLINCHIKCKFICGNCKRTQRESLEKCIQKSAKKGSQNRFKWGVKSKMTYRDRTKRVKSSKKMEFKFGMNANKIELHEMNDATRMENMMRKTHLALNKSLCESEK